MADITESTETEELAGINLLVGLKSNLSNSVISSPAFLGDANLEVKRILPHWANFTGDNHLRLKSIVRKVTAIKILRSVEKRDSLGLAGEINISNTRLEIRHTITQLTEEIEEDLTQLSYSTGNEPTSVAGNSLVTGVVVDGR